MIKNIYKIRGNYQLHTMALVSVGRNGKASFFTKFTLYKLR